MIKKSFLFVVTGLMATLFIAQSSTAEARHCCHNPRVQVNVGTCVSAPRAYVIQRYPRQIAYAPVVAPAVPCTAPIYTNPVYVVAPGYVEEVVVVPQRPLSFGGLSFSWNFFR